MAGMTQVQRDDAVRCVRLAHKCAWIECRRRRGRVPLEDLQGEAMLALVMACMRFDESKGARPGNDRTLHLLWYARRYISSRLRHFARKQLCGGIYRAPRSSTGRTKAVASLDTAMDVHDLHPADPQAHVHGFEPGAIAERCGCDPREAEIISLRYGPDELHLAEIGRMHGISRERTRQLADRALGRMAEHMREERAWKHVSR